MTPSRRMPPSELLALVRRVLAVAPEHRALYALARLAGTQPHGWLDPDHAPWVIAEELVSRAEANNIADLLAALDTVGAQPGRNELVRRLLDARRAVEETTREGWQGSVADRVALVAAEEEALAALARDAGLPGA